MRCVSIQAHYYLGCAYQEMQQFESSVECFMKVLEFDNNNSNAYNRLGLSYCCMRRTDDALKAFLKAIELNPQHPEAYTNLGTFLFLFLSHSFSYSYTYSFSHSFSLIFTLLLSHIHKLFKKQQNIRTLSCKIESSTKLYKLLLYYL